MRFLFISNFYPPAGRGGFEQWCQEVADGLRDRGHTVHVLTSAHRKAARKADEPDWIHRSLRLEMELASLRNAFQFFTQRARLENENLTCVRNLLDHVQPDAVLIWGMWNLHRSIAALLEARMGKRMAYYMGDYWPTLPSPFEGYWRASARNVLTGIPKALLKPAARAILARELRPALRFEHVLFPSQFMLDDFAGKGVAMRRTRVIYGAIDTRAYLGDRGETGEKRENVSLLFVGRVSKEKGAHTAIQAIGCLTRTYGLRNVKLTIVGDGEPEYRTFLRDLIETEEVARLVQLVPAQPKESLPALYQQADIFLFTSIWAEPFGRVLVEAMASGTPVIGTRVGGASEILIENENALTFPPDDPLGLARQIKRLIESPDLRRRLAGTARETAASRFDIHRMTDEIGAYLESIARS
jgi:glycosyltransferase involved in cell wall biosynthesis